MQKTEVIRGIQNLGNPPEIACELLRLNHTNSTKDAILSLLLQDRNLHSDFLKLCNVSALHDQDPATTLDQAISIIDLEEIAKLTWILTMGPKLGNPLWAYGIPSNGILHHSLTVALAAEGISKRYKFFNRIMGDAFIAGLLHDIGKVIANQIFLKKSKFELATLLEQSYSILEAEEQILGTNHAEITGDCLEYWGFPKHIIDAVTHHHQNTFSDNSLAAIIHVSNFCAHAVGSTYGVSSYSNLFNLTSLEVLNLKPVDIQLAMSDLYSKFDEIDIYVNFAKFSAQRIEAKYCI